MQSLLSLLSSFPSSFFPLFLPSLLLNEPLGHVIVDSRPSPSPFPPFPTYSSLSFATPFAICALCFFLLCTPAAAHPNDEFISILPLMERFLFPTSLGAFTALAFPSIPSWQKLTNWLNMLRIQLALGGNIDALLVSTRAWVNQVQQICSSDIWVQSFQLLRNFLELQIIPLQDNLLAEAIADAIERLSWHSVFTINCQPAIECPQILACRQLFLLSSLSSGCFASLSSALKQFSCCNRPIEIIPLGTHPGCNIFCQLQSFQFECLVSSDDSFSPRNAPRLPGASMMEIMPPPHAPSPMTLRGLPMQMMNRFSTTGLCSSVSTPTSPFSSTLLAAGPPYGCAPRNLDALLSYRGLCLISSMKNCTSNFTKLL